jgi:hypothetical protein
MDLRPPQCEQNLRQQLVEEGLIESLVNSHTDKLTVAGIRWIELMA